MSDIDRLLKPRKSQIQRDAGFLRRAFALLIDFLVLDFFITAPFTPLFETIVARGTLFAFQPTPADTALISIVLLIMFAYFVVFEYTLGQTPGMMLAKIRANEPLKLWKSLVRNSFALPFFPFFLLWIIEPIAVMLFRRRLLEHLTQTRTLYKKEVLF